MTVAGREIGHVTKVEIRYGVFKELKVTCDKRRNCAFHCFMFFLAPSVRVISESRIKYGYPIAFRCLIHEYADEQLE